MTVGEALAEGAALLKTASIETPRLDAALLLAEALHTDRAGLILRYLDPVSGEPRQRYGEFLKQRLAGDCVAYIVGHKEFRGLDFAINPGVLVPRPDTETLVEAALSYIDGLPACETCMLLDMCTGSGAVGIALKHERPRIALYASDISVAALKTAQENARRLLGNRDGDFHFIQSDLFDRIEGRFTLITANPPYIPSAVIETLAQEVKQEPWIGLDGGEDGLEIIRRLIPKAKQYLSPGGMLLIEADPRQMSGIGTMLRDAGYREIKTYDDLSGRQRVIGGGREEPGI
ncbi:MAG: peptide chain release factor N(5)-glutamine methyltransferase [Treponema sp.]|jgi:release factor glutamine methyltransferase|nr:peptide chain release factor N(5)-glutamine methyltransferase [Treponema sp.]